MKLRTYFSISFVSLIVVVVVTMSIVISLKISSEVKQEIGGSLNTIAYQMGDKLDQYMWSRYNEIILLSRLKAIREASDKEEANQLLLSLRQDIPSFSWVGIIDPNGRVEVSTGGLMPGADISARPVYTEALKAPFIGDVHDAVLLSKLLPNPTGEAMKFVDISTPLYDDQNQLSGVLAAHLSWEWAKEVKDSILRPLKGKKNAQIEVFILSGKDSVVLLGPDGWIGKKLDFPNARDASGGYDWDVQQWQDGQSYLTGYAEGAGYLNFPGLNWKIVVRQPDSVAFSSVRELLAYVAMIGIALAAFFAWIGWLLAGRISKPLSDISSAANRLRFGEKVLIPYVRGIKDIELLSASLRSLVAELSATESELSRMEDRANHDKLTGLLNRSAMDKVFRKAMEEANERGTALAFLCLDLDGFKAVNDRFGHAAGDELLIEVANRLRACLREGDYLFRMGGDEFMILLSTASAGSIKETEAIAKRILRALREYFIIDNHRLSISCSIGAALWPQHGQDPEELIKDADRALYRSKRKGKNQLSFTETKSAHSR